MRTAARTATFLPSSEVERWIESFGVSWEFVTELPLDNFDKKASLSNQARRTPLDRDTGQVYAEAMRGGAIFPPLIGYRKPNGAVVLIDGNHRLYAAPKAGLSNVACYIVLHDADTSVLTDMLASANATLNGKEAATDDRLRHGMRLVDAGCTQKHAARLSGVPSTTLSSFAHHQYVLRRAEKHGAGRDAKSLPLSYAKALSSNLDKLKPADLKALLAAASHARNAPEFNGLVKDVISSNGHAARVIEGFLEERRAINSPKSARKKTTVSPYHSFLMHGAAIAKHSPEEVVAACPLGDLEKLKRLAEEIRYISSKVAAP